MAEVRVGDMTLAASLILTIPGTPMPVLMTQVSAVVELAPTTNMGDPHMYLWPTVRNPLTWKFQEVLALMYKIPPSSSHLMFARMSYELHTKLDFVMLMLRDTS
jgi:hypothetical protein